MEAVIEEGQTRDEKLTLDQWADRGRGLSSPNSPLERLRLPSHPEGVRLLLCA